MEIAPLPADPDVVPADPPSPDTGHSTSSCTISSLCGPGLTLWSVPEPRLAPRGRGVGGEGTSPESRTEIRLQLSPEAPVIIGRQEGGEIEYLDPRYAPSPIVPGTGRTILQQDGTPRDTYVSRGHFMLRSHATGILFTNGVPRRGGGIRPPRNWTQLLHPHQ